MYLALLALIFISTTSNQEIQDTIKIILLKEVDGQDHIVQWYQEALSSANTNLKLNTIAVDVSGDEEDLEKVCKALSEGGTMMLDLTWSSNDLITDLSLEIGIPYVKVDVSISPFLILLDKYLDLRNSTDVTLIFDDNQYIDQSLYYWIDTTRLRMLISEKLDRATARRLKHIRPIPNSFAIIATTTKMDTLFKVAVQEDLITRPDRWNLLFLDFVHESFDKKLIFNKPISSLKLDASICCNFLAAEELCQCPENFNLPKEFLYLATSIILKVIQVLVKDGLELTNNLQCNGTTYNEQSSKRFEELLEKELDNYNFIYRENSVLRIKVSGNVEVGSNSSTEIVAKCRDNVMTVVDGKTVTTVRPFYRIGITRAIPWSYKEKDPATGQWRWTGYCADFAQKISEQMDFDYEFVEPKSGTFGKKTDGVWNGVIGDLASGETDLAVTSIIMTADKEEVVDFVAPYFEQTGITIVMRKPVRKTSLFKFMTVLKLEVWLSIVAALTVTGFMIWFLDKYSPYSAQNNKKSYSYPCREFTLKESFWFALTSFTPQGGGEAPKALSGRTLVAAYWLFVVLMLATFTANLAAFLTVERMQAPVQSLEQLARQSRINYTVVKNSETHKYFINMKYAEDTLYRMWKELTLNASTDDTRYRVWDYPIKEQYGHILLAINDSDPVANAEEGFRKVDEHLDADYAFIHDSSEIKYEISRNCNMTEVGEVFAEKPYAIAIQQGSHLQDDLSKTILILQKERFFEDLRAKYWNHSNKKQCLTSDDNEGITLESLGGVFIATLFGLALAMITLVGEVIYYRRKRQNETKGNLKKMKVNPENIIKKLNAAKYPITIGTTFKPVNLKDKMQKEREELKLSHVTLYPRARNRITDFHN